MRRLWRELLRAQAVSGCEALAAARRLRRQGDRLVGDQLVRSHA